MTKEDFDNYYKKTEGRLFNYKKILNDIEKRRIEITVNNFTIQQKALFKILYCSRRVRISRNEILRKMHISKSTYYELRNSLVVSALNSIYPTILRDEIYKKFA